MAEKIIMPKAGMAMEKGIIIEWLKEVGDKVSYGEPILEIETDKTTMQVEAMNDGYLLSKLYGAGAEVPVVTTIGYIGEQGEQPPAEDQPLPEPAAITEPGIQSEPERETADTPATTGSTGKILATPAARRLARERGVSLEEISAGGIIHARDIPLSGGVKATPLAKRLADMQTIDLSKICGSGHDGKIFSTDLPQPTAEATVPIPAAAAPAQIIPATSGEDRTVSLNGMRKTIARRMLQSHTEIPPVTLNSEADVTELAALRVRINQIEGVKVSFNDLVVKACATALREFPEINASYAGESVTIRGDVNIGIAVALDNGLIVPVLRNADTLSLKSLSARAKELATKARDGGLLPDEYTGGTFTVSNLGMFGITSFTPIINLPESCILGVCAIKERVALAGDGSVKNRKYMGLSLTFDHRCIDGAGGAKFLQRLVALLENPIETMI